MGIEQCRTTPIAEARLLKTGNATLVGLGVAVAVFAGWASCTLAVADWPDSSWPGWRPILGGDAACLVVAFAAFGSAGVLRQIRRRRFGH